MNRIDAILPLRAAALLLFALLISFLAVALSGANATSDGMDIDYSHNVKGTGTVMTDFKMGSEESTQATGRVRGSGEVINKYIFVSNNSENVSIEDEFLFTRGPATPMITVGDYPQIIDCPGGFRLLGTSWAPKIELIPQNDSFGAK